MKLKFPFEMNGSKVGKGTKVVQQDNKARRCVRVRVCVGVRV